MKYYRVSECVLLFVLHITEYRRKIINIVLQGYANTKCFEKLQQTWTSVWKLIQTFYLKTLGSVSKVLSIQKFSGSGSHRNSAEFSVHNFCHICHKVCECEECHVPMMVWSLHWTKVRSLSQHPYLILLFSFGNNRICPLVGLCWYKTNFSAANGLRSQVNSVIVKCFELWKTLVFHF